MSNETHRQLGQLVRRSAVLSATQIMLASAARPHVDLPFAGHAFKFDLPLRIGDEKVNLCIISLKTSVYEHRHVFPNRVLLKCLYFLNAS